MNKKEKLKKLEITIKKCQEPVAEILGDGFADLEKISIYRAKKKEYEVLYKKICLKISESEFEEIKYIIDSMSSLDNTYSYIKGLIDGIQLREYFTVESKE